MQTARQGEIRIGISPEIHRMINSIMEVPGLHYDDGLHFIYFYTKGTKGGSQTIKNMLTYFRNSDSKNAVDEATRQIDSYVKTVKSLPEVEAGYMTVGDWMDDMVDEIREGLTEEITEELTEQLTEQLTEELTEDAIRIFIETFQEYVDTKEVLIVKLKEKYSAYASKAENLVEKYWKQI